MTKETFGKILDGIKFFEGNFGVECREKEDFKLLYGNSEFVIVVPVDKVDA